MYNPKAKPEPKTTSNGGEQLLKAEVWEVVVCDTHLKKSQSSFLNEHFNGTLWGSQIPIMDLSVQFQFFFKSSE